MTYDKLSVCHVNCQSLMAHFDEFCDFFTNSKYHIICLSETWLKPEILDRMVKLPGYFLIRCDRLGRQGGGVAIYLHHSFRVNILKTSTTDAQYRKPEFLIVEVIFSYACNLLLAVVYRPPNCGYLQEFESAFLELQAKYRHSMILGDFNADMLIDTYDSMQLRTFIAQSGSYLVPFGPTHHLKNSSTFLDLCIMDDADKLTDYGKMGVSFLSAHDLIYVTYDINITRRMSRLVSCRDFKNFKEDDFLSEVGECDWSDLISSECIDSKVQIFNDRLLKCVDKHAPLKRICFRNLPAPWLTIEIRRAMRERDVLRRRWRRTKNAVAHDNYKTMRNLVQNLIRTAKKKYYMDIFSCMDRPANIWDKLRHLGLIKVKDFDRCLTHSVEELNTFFADVGILQNIDNGIQHNLDFWADNFDDARFFFKHITPDIISKALNKIKSGAIGVDGISSRIIKVSLPCVGHIIEHIFNFSLTHGVVPRVWKSAAIVPLPKVRHPTMVQHYRPISILPVLSKVLERIVADQLIEFLTERKLFDPCQFAYKRNTSTQTCIIRMLDEIRHAVDQRMVTISIFFDFSKAFDRVQHEHLLVKLKNKGFSCSALRWMASYLSGRTQAVYDRFENITSSQVQIRSGVPQGSVLSPLLFTLYVSDIGSILQHCKYNFYADDLQIYLHCKPSDIDNGVSAVNEDIKSIVQWAGGCGLLLNSAKTQAILFGSARYINAIELDGFRTTIKINDSPINMSSHVKYLGVTISNTLAWDRQVTNIIKNIRTKLYQLKLSKHLLPRQLKIQLITSLIFPQLDYCCAALTDITGILNTQLYRALTCCIRFALSIRYDMHITPYYRELRWLKVEDRRNYFVGCQLFNIINTRQPSLIYKGLTFRTAVTARDTRASNDLLSLPLCRTETYKRSFNVSASKLWNSLPLIVRQAPSFDIFKNRLYEHLLTTSILATK